MPRPVFRRPAEILSRLRGFRFDQVSEPMLEELVRLARLLSFRHQEAVWNRGDHGTIAYVIEGAFDIVHHGVVVDTLGPGQALGLSALWGNAHSAEVRARRTERDRFPQLLRWDLTEPRCRRLFESAEILTILLKDSVSLIHHLNELQVLYRRKRSAASHIAAHFRRLARCQDTDDEVEIGQRELGALAGYDPRTIRAALGELNKAGCVTSLRRSVYRVDPAALTSYIEREKRGD